MVLFWVKNSYFNQQRNSILPYVFMAGSMEILRITFPNFLQELYLKEH